MVEAGTKRKRPPTFQHLPINRAKKLKQVWVQNTKIKSKWKAEKRKQGSDGVLSSVVGPALEEEKNDGVQALIETAGRAVDQTADTEVIIMPSESIMHPSRVKPDQYDVQISRKDIRQNKESTGQTIPNLRDLTREAYSRSSLHTYRSDPLNRRGGRGREQEKGRGRGRHSQGERRGQPNMKLRMGAILEKIKQDFT